MYAILEQGGHQYRVTPGDRLLVDYLPAATVGAVLALEPLRLLHDGSSATTARERLDGARVAATVVAHRRGQKLRIFKYKPKKRYRKTIGHRSWLTELRVEALLGKGEPLPKPKPATTAPSTPAADAAINEA